MSAEKHQPDNTNGWCSCWTRLSPELFSRRQKLKTQSLSVPQKQKKTRRVTKQMDTDDDDDGAMHQFKWNKPTYDRKGFVLARV